MILVLDTETTGLPANMDAPHTDTENWPHMLSIAWEGYRENGESMGECSYIIEPRPGVINSPGPMSVNKITPEVQEKNGWDIAYVLEHLKGLLSHASLVVAHNVAFDKNIIGAEFARAGLEMPEREWFCTKEDIGNLLQLPTTEAQRKYRPEIEYKQPRLDELYQFLFGKPVPGREESHGAKQDAAACAECYWELKKRGHI